MEIAIWNGAHAVNPAGQIEHDSGDLLFAWIKYPFVPEFDVVDEVVEVGPVVARFKKVGDRVVSSANLRFSIISLFKDVAVLPPEIVTQGKFVTALGPQMVGGDLEHV
ncbi:hypothetical protein H2203_006865 [Taxawa tesnikishii (nom. ined.)]|nr:hypothetical protein H2203_006865 [Dothideales sp. JES 119]